MTRPRFLRAGWLVGKMLRLLDWGLVAAVFVALLYVLAWAYAVVGGMAGVRA